MNPNRIDPLAPPPPKPKPPAWKAWALRLGASIAGAALGASCPLWPAAAQPVCRAVAGIVQTAAGTLPVDPPQPEEQ